MPNFGGGFNPDSLGGERDKVELKGRVLETFPLQQELPSFKKGPNTYHVNYDRIKAVLKYSPTDPFPEGYAYSGMLTRVYREKAYKGAPWRTYVVIGGNAPLETDRIKSVKIIGEDE